MARSPPLREAHEETGLNPDTVEIVGVLPTLALPDTGFLLTPVLAWSAQPAFPEPANLAEVTLPTSRHWPTSPPATTVRQSRHQAARTQPDLT